MIRSVLQEFREGIHGMIHCTGGGQTKVMNFVDRVRVVKDNLFEPPPLFRLIREQSATPWKEMYQVFNMGHRLEIYVEKSLAEKVMAVSGYLGVSARIIGHVELARNKELVIEGPEGKLVY